MSTEWDTTFVPPWHGLPSGTASCSVIPLSQSSLTLIESEVLLPGRPGIVTRRPSLSFLITRENGERALFDLGIPTDWLDWIKPEEREYFKRKFEVEIERDLYELLESPGEGHVPVKRDEVGLLVISHQHWDHTGSPSSFPSARVLVGSTSEASAIPSLAHHPNVTPINWDSSIHPPIASFPHSLDVFQDGSLTILDARGHTPGHIAALVRTSPGEYVLLFADGCHHHCISSIRKEDEHYRLGLYRAPGDPEDRPPTRSFYDDYAEAGRVVERMRVMQRREDVMCVQAHDEVLWQFWGGGGQSGWGPELKGWREKGLKMK